MSPSSPVIAPDLERCLELIGADVPVHNEGKTSTAEELFSTLGVLTGYYTGRADLSRATKALELLRAALEQWQPGSWPRTDAWAGVLAFLRGQFASAREQLELATDPARSNERSTETVSYLPIDPIVAARIHLALVRLIQGSLPAAEAELARAAQSVEGMGFPQGPYSLAYLRFVEIWVLIETGRFDRASALAVDMVEDAQRHGFNQWRLRGTIQQAVADALAIAAGPAPAVDDRIAEITGLVDELRAADLNVYLTFFEGALARLMIAAGRRDSARLDAALAMACETGMAFYDSELLRLRSHVQTDEAARRADLESALQLARRQGANLFELRCALDYFELRGQAASDTLTDALSRLPADGSLAESARAADAVAAPGPQ